MRREQEYEPNPVQTLVMARRGRMRISHVAVWVTDVDAAAEFWSRYFDAAVGLRYASKRRAGFVSRFVRLPSDGGSIELMSAPWIEAPSLNERIGWAHIAISLGSTEAVDAMARRFAESGLLAEHPRQTGDGFYEAVVRTADGVLIELTS